MNLSKKKSLASRTFNVGKKRIVFVESRKDELKEAITKQDMRELQKEGAIIIKEIKGKRKKVKEKRRRSPGNIRKKVNKRKREYVILTRKLRKHIADLKSHGKLPREDAKDIRKKIRDSKFKNKSHLEKYLKTLTR